MDTFIDKFNRKVMSALALETLDSAWSAILQESMPAKCLSAFSSFCRRHTTRLSWLGSALQQLTIPLVALMLAIMAAPKFADDKGILAIIVCLAWSMRLLGYLLNGQEQYRPSAADALVLFYLSINIVASCGSYYFKESLIGLSKLVVYVIAYFLFTGCLQYNTKRRSAFWLVALQLGGFLVAIYGLWQFKHHVAPLATWEDPTVEEKTTRIFSTLKNPNLLAGYLLPLVPLSFGLSMISAAKGGWLRLLCIPSFAATAAIAVATVLTGSRGGYIGLIAVALSIGITSVVWQWCRWPKMRPAILAALVLLPVLAGGLIHFALPHLEHRFLSIFAGSEHSSNAYRMNVWRSSLAMFMNNWWLGIGTGNKTFRLVYGLYMKSGFDALGTYCVPLEVAVECGILGLLAFGCLTVTCLAKAHLRFWQTSDDAQRWLSLSCAAAIIGMLAHGLVDTVFYRPQAQFIFWLAVSLLVALPATTEVRRAETDK